MVQTSFVAARLCMVWLATCPILSPVIRPSTSSLTCKCFCDTHHITTHNDGQFIVRAFFVDIKLDICKVDHMQMDRSAVFCNEFCKIHNFLFCSFACIRRSMEVTASILTPRFAIMYPATGLSIPPDNRSIAYPFVPTGIPPAPGMICEYT